MKRSLYFWTLLAVSGCGLSTITAQVTTTTSGPGGDVCENGQRICLSGESSCVNDRCECNTGSGNGNFACYPPGYIFAELKNDPQVITFAGERVEVPLPCRYLLVHVMNNFKSNPARGSCEIQVFSYGIKERGKFYVYGFDAYINVFHAPSGKNKGVSIRKVGTGRQGSYTFQEWGKDTSDQNAPWAGPVSVNAFGQTLECQIDNTNNRAIVDIEDCGFLLTFRPADLDLGKDQVQMPGIAVALRNDDDTVFLSKSSAIALPVFQVGPTVGQVCNAFDLAPEEAFLTLALVGAASQDFPDASSKCNDVVNVMAMCTDGDLRKEAVELCSFILMWPPFVRCWSQPNPSSSDAILDLFARCVDVICHEKTPECEMVVNEVKINPVCEPKALDEFTGFTCVFS